MRRLLVAPVACLWLAGVAAAGPLELWVGSWLSHQVLRYDGLTGQYLGVAAAGGGLDLPLGFIFGPDGNLYVSSYGQFAGQVLRYHGITGAFLGIFVPVGSGGMLGPHMLVFRDTHLYVSHSGDGIAAFDAVTGAYTGDLVSPGSGGLDDAQGFLWGPDGNLYVCDNNSFRILRYTASGQFLDVFVPVASGGLSYPCDLAFGPDGHLYVSSFGNDQVLRYNGTTGAFIDDFIPDGYGGVDGPYYLMFHEHRVLGDVNCDDEVDFGDINPFVLLLSDPAGWQAAFPGCLAAAGDCNEDGHVGFEDINPFVALLTGQ